MCERWNASETGCQSITGFNGNVIKWVNMFRKAWFSFRWILHAAHSSNTEISKPLILSYLLCSFKAFMQPSVGKSSFHYCRIFFLLIPNLPKVCTNMLMKTCMFYNAVSMQTITAGKHERYCCLINNIFKIFAFVIKELKSYSLFWPQS